MQTVSTGAPKGVIRFNSSGGSPVRFATNRDPIDLNMGLDGLLYVLFPGGFPEGEGLAIYDPVTLTQIDLHTFNFTPHRAVAANAAGEFFLADFDGDVQRMAPDGSLISQINVCGIISDCRLMDIDVSPDGKLVIGSVTGRVLLANSDLTGLQLVGPQFPNSVFVTFVPEPATALLLLSALSLCLGRARRRD
jgi:hypothetical protein